MCGIVESAPRHRNWAVNAERKCFVVARNYRTQAMASIKSALEEKSAECAREARKQAALLAPGPVRDALLQKAKEYEAEIPEDETYE